MQVEYGKYSNTAASVSNNLSYVCFNTRKSLKKHTIENIVMTFQ